MNKLSTARILMAATIVVIIAFQVYWLRKLYQEEQDSFKKTTDVIFKEAIYKLQAERFTGDIKFIRMGSDNVFMTDVISSVNRISLSKDSGAKPKMIVSTHTQFIGLNEDSIRKQKKDTVIFVDAKPAAPAPVKIENVLERNKTLNDTIPVARIDSLYNALLIKDGINVPYKIVRIDPLVSKDTTGGNITIRLADPNHITDPASPSSFFATKRVPVGFVQPTFYRAEFATPTMFLLKKISLQLLLSFLLIALTTLSFIFIYRSLVAQKRLTAIKNEFIGNITHELKTPISTVSVAIEAMKNFDALKDPGRTQEYLGIAGQELNRLSLLVDKVLRLSMFETQQVELKYEWFDVKALVKEVVKSMQLQFEKSGAKVNLDVDGEDFAMMADQMHITSVVYNLLDNALKYSRDKPEIDIQLDTTGKDITLRVKDNGIGIAAAYKDKVFDKFFRVPNGDKHNVKGYGLGLSYVAHIVAQHKGTVQVESEVGKGTTFIIKLPKENAGS